MQPKRLFVALFQGQHFQYPRSDRAGCNMNFDASLRGDGLLSVSSVGSSGMQQNRSSRGWRDGVPLSVSSVGSSGMQPRSPGGLVRAQVFFQYPRSDRAGCNFLRRGTSMATGSTFSILGRIERDATMERLHAKQVGIEPFSILGRIERDATATGRSI